MLVPAFSHRVSSRLPCSEFLEKIPKSEMRMHDCGFWVVRQDNRQLRKEIRWNGSFGANPDIGKFCVLHVCKRFSVAQLGIYAIEEVTSCIYTCPYITVQYCVPLEALVSALPDKIHGAIGHRPQPDLGQGPKQGALHRSTVRHAIWTSVSALSPSCPSSSSLILS